MIAATALPFVSPAKFLCWEVQQNLRYEDIEGKVGAMTGGTFPHNSIALNPAAALKNHLRGHNGKVFMADAKLSINDQEDVGPDYTVRTQMLLEKNCGSLV